MKFFTDNPVKDIAKFGGVVIIGSLVYFLILQYKEFHVDNYNLGDDKKKHDAKWWIFTALYIIIAFLIFVGAIYVGKEYL